MSVEFRDPIDLNQLELQNAALQNLASDPAAPVTGQVWQRTDLGKSKVRVGAKTETFRYESNNTIDASTASGNGPLVINTDGTGTDTALSIGATGINSPRLLVDVATQTPKLQAYTVAASTSMEPTLLQALDSNSKTAITADSVKVQRTDITESMELTTSDLLKNGVSVLNPTVAASSVTFAPVGNIAATNVQSAVAELDTKSVHIAGKETITGAKTLSSSGYAGVPNFARTDPTTTTTIWCANVEKITPAASAPADGMGPGLAFVHSKDNAPGTKYGLGAIEFQRNGSDTSGKFMVNTRNAGVDTYPLMADQSGVEAYRNLTIRSTSAQTAGSELRFFPTYNDSDSGKQYISWWNTAEDTRRALIGYREGGLPDTNDKDLRIVSVYPIGTTYASGQRGIRIGTAIDTTTEAGTGSFTIAPYGSSHAGIWPGFVAAASRTTSNYALVTGNTSTWVNVPSASGTVGIAINDVSMMEVKNNLITCFSSTSGAMTVNGNSFVVNSASADLSGTTTTYLPYATFGVFPLLSRQSVEPSNSISTTAGLIAWDCDIYQTIWMTTGLTGQIQFNFSNARAGRTMKVSFIQGSTSRNVVLNLTGVNWWRVGDTAATANTLTIASTNFSANSRYQITIQWFTTTNAFVTYNY